ncbi:hypothetical protein FRD01_07025 [Microvenator marinus]|jgi:hypothetical protein|uniref:Uncharacterized protein n=1 Tax=Microvenator marinus TaxID=2600177 RepID=A0A5B8XPC6_9DELT|nr:hypothetical protein [Microvenator marinus]QED26997.1 hypothetical protein FRD01_07025 [Microvenator marinus]
MGRRALVAATLATLTFNSAWAESKPPSLDGEWALVQVQTSESRVPVVGAVISTTTSVLHVRMKQNGKNLKVASTPCAVQIKSEIDTVKTVIPQAFLDAVGTTNAVARIEEINGKWVFDQAPSVSVTGAVLKNNWRDPLPTSADDQRVFDADSDGRPGVSVLIRGLLDGSIFLVQRSWTALRGVLSSKDQIAGTVRWNTEQKVLDATSMFLKSEPETRPHPDKERSRFVARRIPTGTQCSEIVKTPRLNTL